MLEHTAEVRVRYADTDQMAVAYHGAYLPWLEIARTDMLRARGVVYRDLEAAGFRLPVLELQLEFREPARYDDIVLVTARCHERPRVRIRIAYEIHRGATLLARASTVHAFVDTRGKVVKPPPVFLALWP